MDKSIKRLCSICVRGGSKGVPTKNIRTLYGKPLFVHSMDQAKASGLFDYIVVSSDSKKILDIAETAGSDLSILRPKYLAGDRSPKLPAIQHCLKKSEKKFKLEFDVVVDLDATSPLRSIEDIEGVDFVILDGPALKDFKSEPSTTFNLMDIVNHLGYTIPYFIDGRSGTRNFYGNNTKIANTFGLDYRTDIGDIKEI